MINDYTMHDFLKKIWKFLVLIIATMIIGGIIMGIVAKVKQHKNYVFTQSILISKNLNNVNNANGINVNNELAMMNTYGEVVTSGAVLDRAYDQLPKKLANKYTIEELRKRVHAVIVPNSLVLNLQIYALSANDAVQLSRVITSTVQKELPRFQPGIGKISLLSVSKVRDVVYQVTPSLKKYVVIGGILGSLVGVILSVSYVEISGLKKQQINSCEKR